MNIAEEFYAKLNKELNIRLCVNNNAFSEFGEVVYARVKYLGDLYNRYIWRESTLSIYSFKDNQTVILVVIKWSPKKKPPERPPNPSYDRLILQELHDDETVSCRQIARSTKIPYSSVNYALHTRLHYKPVNVHYVPHILTEQNKIQRVEYCKELLPILQKCKRRNYRFIITGDESWILYYTPNGCIWLKEGDPIPNAVRGGFQIPKVLLAIFWNTLGIASIHVLPNGETMNSNTFINNVLKPIKKYHCFIQAKNRNKRSTYILIIVILIRPNVCQNIELLKDRYKVAYIHVATKKLIWMKMEYLKKMLMLSYLLYLSKLDNPSKITSYLYSSKHISIPYGVLYHL